MEVVLRYCTEYGMSINKSKTKFMVINGSSNDKQNIKLATITIDSCDHYIYLGSPITSDASYKSVISRHKRKNETCC